jgi:hypothetical protein
MPRDLSASTFPRLRSAKPLPPLHRVPILRALRDDDRGDVPGWVLITLMTAGLVIIIWTMAGPALSGVFEQAIQRVTGI